MEDEWRARLRKVVDADPRDMKAISKDAGCGPNYVQQLFSEKNDPRVSKFLRVLATLGRPASLYVILGTEMTREQEELMRLVFSVPDETQKTVRDLLRQYPLSVPKP